ncbi:MAG: universal stress protein [Phycisphaerae bacterium]|nr:universal stress protein [Phycisphaerae bacterium]NIW96219.1 universal stress protein [Phycisphaerae bacterium]
MADYVVRHAPCDLMLLKLVNKPQFKTCLFPTAGGPHARLAALFLKELAVQLKMTVTAAYVVPENATPQMRSNGERWIENTLRTVDSDINFEKQIIEANSVAGGLAMSSRNFDLVVIGAAKEPLFRRILFGEIPEKVARYSPTSVLLVKRYEGVVKSMLKKVLG